MKPKPVPNRMLIGPLGYAEHAIDGARGGKYIDTRHYGGHRHHGARNPLLDIPLPGRNPVRSITITERHNQYIVRVSDGRSSSGATLESALSKILPQRPGAPDQTIEEFFASIIDRPDGQIQQGQASG